MEKILTRNIHKENSTSIGVYEADGGYASMRKALSSMSPDEVTEAVKASGLAIDLAQFVASSTAPAA